MSSFLLLVTASPQNTQAHLTALRFAHQLTVNGLEIKAVFFYQDAISVALNSQLPPSDEPQLCDRWTAFAKNNQIQLQTCVAASLRRGVLSSDEAEEHHIEHANLATGFVMTGLGQLAAGISTPNVKLIHFK